MMARSDPYDEHFEGTWRIVATELWSLESLDLLGPAYIAFVADRLGTMRFIAVDVTIDYRTGSWGGDPIAEFTFLGHDDADPTSGRGWVRLVQGELHGRLFFHQGDEFWFVARPANDEEVRGKRQRRGRRSTAGTGKPPAE